MMRILQHYCFLLIIVGYPFLGLHDGMEQDFKGIFILITLK
jgi:hypothetical protein